MNILFSILNHFYHQYCLCQSKNFPSFHFEIFVHAAILGEDIAFYSKPPEADTLWDEQEEVQKTQEVKIVQKMKEVEGASKAS